MLNKLIAGVIISAGVGSMFLSAYWSALDYTALVQANQLLSAKAKTGSE